MNQPLFAFFAGTPGGMELLLVCVVVLLLFGAKNVPKFARTLGRTIEEFRRASREVTKEIMYADEPDAPGGIPRPEIDQPPCPEETQAGIPRTQTESGPKSEPSTNSPKDKGPAVSDEGSPAEPSGPDS